MSRSKRKQNTHDFKLETACNMGICNKTNWITFFLQFSRGEILLLYTTNCTFDDSLMKMKPHSECLHSLRVTTILNHLALVGFESYFMHNNRIKLIAIDLFNMGNTRVKDCYLNVKIPVHLMSCRQHPILHLQLSGCSDMLYLFKVIASLRSIAKYTSTNVYHTDLTM